MSILHSVFFYFDENISASEIELQRKAILEELSQIEQVKWVKSGAPAGIVRDIVDNSYGMSLHLEVGSKEELDIYQAHEKHQNFLKRFKAGWKAVKVFDTAI